MAEREVTSSTLTFREHEAGWRQRRARRHLLTQVGAHASLLVLSLLFSIPFLWLVSSSLKPNSQLFKIPPEWIPNPFTWSNYPDALTYIPYFKYLGNTAYICAFNVVASVVACSYIAYGFSRVEWPGREAAFLVLIGTMMLPYTVTMIPTFLIFKRLGWVNTFAPLTWPAWTGTPFYIFLLRQFYRGIPMELSDSARIDGCNELGIYRRIMLPLTKPVLATVALFSFLANWNDFLGPLIYLRDQNKWTIALGMYGFMSYRVTQWGLLMAAATVTVAPVILLFFFTQKTFIQGITLTGLKA